MNLSHLFHFLSSLRFSLLSWTSIRIAANWSCTSVTWPLCVRSETQSSCRTSPRPLPITALTPPPGIRSCTAWRRNRWDCCVCVCVCVCVCMWVCACAFFGNLQEKWGHFSLPPNISQWVCFLFSCMYKCNDVCVLKWSFSLCVFVCVCRSKTHTGPTGRFLAPPLTLLKRFTLAGHLTTSSWLGNKYRFQTFYFTGSKLCFELLAEQGGGWGLFHTGRTEEMKSLFI